MIRNMSDIEKEKLISELQKEEQNNPMIEDAFKIIQIHINN